MLIGITLNPKTISELNRAVEYLKESGDVSRSEIVEMAIRCWIAEHLPKIKVS